MEYINQVPYTREITPFESNKFLRIFFTAIFVIAVFIVPPITAIRFFLA